MRDQRRELIKTLSLFSGAGGLDIGFHAAGFDIIACVEIDSNYCKTLKANKGPGRTYSDASRVLCEDVRRFDAKQFADRGIECIIGGPPCQTFSAAGRRSGGVLGTSDARGRLFNAYCEILSIIKPQVFVFENVYGLPGANNGGPWREIVSAFSALGYTLAADVLDAADYGVPQHRERLIMVGYQQPGSFKFPYPTHGPDSPTGRSLVTVGDSIADLQDGSEEFHNDLGGLYGHLLPLVPPGLNYAFFTREMGYPEPIFAWRSKFHDFLYKVDPDYPCRTIKAKPGKFTGPFHWKNRRFTLPELKRLQSFPDDYTIVGTYGKVVEQIGNSVPPRLAHVIAKSVREQLIDHAPSLTYPRREAGFSATFRQRQRERTNHFKRIAKSVVSERFPDVGEKRAKVQRPKQTYYVWYEGFFIKHLLTAKPPKATEGKSFEATVTFGSDEVTLSFDRIHAGRACTRRIKVEIGGLHEGLTTLKSLTANAEVCDLHDIFFLWDAVEDVLVQNSRFLTLIDVYGHYANRGDTVVIDTDVIGGPATYLVRALRFFGNSANCGANISRGRVISALRITDPELDDLINDLRAMRFDIRTRRTHPTIAPGMVLCTYPFPLLSGKAHLERRLKPESFEPDLIEGIETSLFG